MHTPNSPMLTLARSGMDFSWRYAWAYYMAFVALRTGFPLLPAVCAFGMAAVITHLTRTGNWRIYQVVACQAVETTTSAAASSRG